MAAQEQRTADLEVWAATLQEEVDRNSAKLDTGTLKLRKSVDKMGDLLDSMEQQRRLVMPVAELNPDELQPEELHPATAEDTFLNPYTPIVHKLRKAFNKEELEHLVHGLNIDLEDVGGVGLMDICKRLVDYAARRKVLRRLMEEAGKQRPPPEQWTELL